MLFGKKIIQTVVCLDTTNDGSAFLDNLHETLKGYNLVYMSDPLGLPYEGRKEEEIQNIMTHMLDKALEYKPQLIIALADGLYEYGYDTFKKTTVPIIYVTELLLETLKQNYEQKNIVLALKEETISSNIYQKAVKYNHMYTLPLNHLALDTNNEVDFNYEENFRLTKPKTEESFALIEQLVNPIKDKEIDVFLTSSARLNRFGLEIGEFIKNSDNIDCDRIDIEQLLKEKITSLITIKEKDKVGSLTIYSTQKEQILKEELSDVKTKYQIEV